MRLTTTEEHQAAVIAWAERNGLNPHDIPESTWDATQTADGWVFEYDELEIVDGRPVIGKRGAFVRHRKAKLVDGPPPSRLLGTSGRSEGSGPQIDAEGAE